MHYPTPTIEVIQDFLAQKRIAMIGASRDPNDFSSSLFGELRKQGYEVIPVNPKAPAVMGERCFPRIQDVHPPVDTVLLMTPADITDAVVKDCAEAGIRRIWMYRAGGKGAVSPSAVKFCQEHGIQVIPGQCPFMFLPGAGGIHRFHGFIRTILGSYPKHQHAA